jgi:hypothetical protein
VKPVVTGPPVSLDSSGDPRFASLLIGLAAASLLGSPAGLHAQPGTLFPEPFRIEHHVVHDDGDGSLFVGDPVVDTYGGSWIVSQRPDGSRRIVDLARREVTELRPDDGTYWSLSFDRVAELQARLKAAQGLGGHGPVDPTSPAPAADLWNDRAGTDPLAATGGDRRAPELDLTVTDVEVGRSSKDSAIGSTTGSLTAASRQLRVAPRNGRSGDAVEVWVDPTLKLTPAALAALVALEESLTSRDSRAVAPTAASHPGRFVAAARAHGGGGMVVKTRRPAALSAQGEAIGSVEDVATRVERLPRLDPELVAIPEGLRRVPHPLEATVRFLEEDAERNAAMSGAGSGGR